MVNNSRAMLVILGGEDATNDGPCAGRGGVQTIAEKITNASTRWVASRYCETSTRCESPEATIHQPTAPCSAPRPKISHSRRFRSALKTPRQRNQRNGNR